MSSVPSNKLDGSGFQELIEGRFERYFISRQAHVKRYGVQATGKFNPQLKKMEWRPIRSFPDYDGVLFPSGRQIVFDAKARSEGGLSLSEYKWVGIKSKPNARQLRHMLERAEAGCLCGFLIHFNSRELATKLENAATWLFPVHPTIPFWEAFMRGEKSSISRKECQRIAVSVVWNNLGLEKTLRPDFLLAFQELSGMYPFDHSAPVYD